MQWKETGKEPKWVGAIDDTALWLEEDKESKGLSRNYKQGYRVYSTDGIAGALTANGGGIAGQCGALYLVDSLKGDSYER